MATTTIQDFVDAIATKADIDPPEAEAAVGTICRRYNKKETRLR